MRKRVVSFALSVILALSCLPMQVFAVNTTDSTLEVGKTYSIPITRYDEGGNLINWSGDGNGIGEYIIQPKALVQLGKDGKYTVTLAWAHYESLDMLQFLKQGTVENGASVADISMKAENIPEVFAAFNPDKISRTKSAYAYSPILKTVVQDQAKEEDSNKYIDDVTISSEPDENGFTYFTMQLENLDQWLYYKAFASALYPGKTQNDFLKLSGSNADGTPVDVEENTAKIKEIATESCFTGGAIAFNTAEAREVVALSKYQSENTSRHVSCPYDAFEYESTTDDIDALIQQSIQVKQKDDGSLSATFTVTDDADISAVYDVYGYTDYTSKVPVYLLVQMYRSRLQDLYQESAITFDRITDSTNGILDPNSKTFSLDFASAEEATWGKLIQIKKSNGDLYDVVLSISAVDNTVTFTSDNMTFTTDKDNINTDGVFSSNPLTEGDDYSRLSAMLTGHSANYLIYQPTFMVGTKKRNPTANVNISMNVPEDWDMDKFKMYRLMGTTQEGSLIEINEQGPGTGTEYYRITDNENHTCVLSTKNLNNTYILVETGEAASTQELQELEDGVYSLDLVSWNQDQPDQLSMSNVAIDKSSAKLFVADGQYTLYYALQPIYISGKKGYAQRLFGVDSNNQKTEYTYYSWVTQDDGSSVYDVDYYGINYGLYYPSSVSTTFQKTDITDGGAFITEFWVPPMDEVSGYTPGSGKGSRTALLKFYNPTKLDDNTKLPTYEPSFLLKSVEDAEVYTKATSTDMYDAETFAALTTQAENARAVLNVAAGETVTGDTYYNKSTELDAALADMMAASLNGMITRANGLNQSDYTETGWTNVQSTLETAIAVSNNESATVAEQDDALQKLYAAVEGLTEQVDKSVLKEKLEEANEELAKTDTYTSSSLSALKTLVDAAQAVYEDETATQTAVDEQVTALTSGIKALVQQADKTALQTKYDEALVTYNQGNDAGIYDADTWNAFKTAVENAKKVLDDSSATEAEIEAARTALFNTMNNLTVSVNKSALTALIATVEKMDVSGYTETSVAALQKALDAARAAVDDDDATQAEINALYNALSAAADALVKADDGNTVYDGTYTIFGRLWQASHDIPDNWADSDAEGASMGDNALNNTIGMTVKDGKATLNLEFIQNVYTLLGEQQYGYLGNLSYYPGYTDTAIPSGLMSTPVTIKSYWEDENGNHISDSYGTDYPRYMELPLENLGQNLVWVQVYVPVMESISAGTGTQLAKLVLDWDSRVQTSGIDTDKTALNNLIAQAKEISQGSASEEAFAALQSAIASAESVSNNMNVDQKTVDATVKMLQAAMDAVTIDPTQVDKTELNRLISQAQGYVDAEDVTYSEATLAVLKTALAQAKKVAADDEATQNEVNAAVINLQNAIGGLISISDKSNLKNAIDAANKILADSDSYTAAALEALRNLTQQAQAVYENSNASQSEIDALTSALNYMINRMEKVDYSSVNKDSLVKMLIVSANMAGRESVYTADSLKALKKAIEAAQAVYDNKTATEEDVQKQVSALTTAILALEQKQSTSIISDNPNGSNNSGDSNNSGSSNNSGDNNNSGAGDSKLDVKNLSDGVYYVTGKMLKVDKSTLSMSNDAINHTIKITVKDGKYTVTMDFKGLTVGDKLGYLSELKYFKTGYTTDGYGNPQGTTAAVTVDAYQKDSSGNLVSDTYGTNYPATVSFELISEALNNGYVPLQVFVPIMESISKGTGTQPVYLSLDWSTLSTSNNGSGDNNNNNNNGTNNTNNTNGTNGTTSTSGTNGTNGTTSTLNSSKLPSSGSTTGTSTLSGSTGKTGTTGTNSLSGSTGKTGTTGTTSVQTSDTEPLTGWLALLAVSCMALTALFVEKKLRKGEKL